MPGRDGTGPVGKGPMTGARSGSCMLSIPDSPDEPIKGFAGETGWRFAYGGKPQRRKDELDMPGFDKTGPSGEGSMTGGKKGSCTGFGWRRTAANAGFMGRCRGWRNRFFSTGLSGWQRWEGFCFRGGRRRLGPF